MRQSSKHEVSNKTLSRDLIFPNTLIYISINSVLSRYYWRTHQGWAEVGDDSVCAAGSSVVTKQWSSLFLWWRPNRCIPRWQCWMIDLLNTVLKQPHTSQGLALTSFDLRPRTDDTRQGQDRCQATLEAKAEAETSRIWLETEARPHV